METIDKSQKIGEFAEGKGYLLLCHWSGCKKPEGRFFSNRSDPKFCSGDCKTAFHNSKNKGRRARERQITKDISKNDRVLHKLYLIYGTNKCPGEILDRSGYNRNCHYGSVKSEKSKRPGYYYIDYVLSLIPEGGFNYQIFRKEEYDLV